MLDFNNKQEINRVRGILKGLGSDVQDYFEYQINKLKDKQDDAKNFEEILGNREARKILKEILGFIR